MRNVTVRLEDDLVRRAKVEAARQDKSLSRYVAELLARELSGGASQRYTPEYERAMRSNLARGPYFKSDPSKPYPTREELYDRPLLRRHKRAPVSEGHEGSEEAGNRE